MKKETPIPTRQHIIWLGTKYCELPSTNQKKLWKKIAEKIPGNYTADVYANLFTGKSIPAKLRVHHLRAINLVERKVKRALKRNTNN